MIPDVQTAQEIEALADRLYLAKRDLQSERHCVLGDARTLTLNNPL